MTIGFIGNPNCGKTTLFNAYTGANLKVANWPGSLYIVYNLYLLSLNETKLLGSTMSSIIILLLNVICFKMFDKIAADAEIKRKNDIYKQSIDKKRKCNIRKTNFLISGANICKRNCHVK